jgi:23S rRNA pseudouridine1911/1915/1917 synthase
LREAAEPSSRRLTVEAEPAEGRLDAYLAARLPDLSRSRIVQLISEGHVRLNGTVVRKSRRPAAGDVLEIEVPPARPSHITPEAIPLRIVYEDADLLVVDKPAGLVVHPAVGHDSGTLVNALLHHVPDLAGIGGVRRPGLVHRLDKDTSGLLVVAKNELAHARLSAALKRRTIRRIYLVAAWGHLGDGERTVAAPIARSPVHRQRMAVVEGGRPARTRFTRLERWRAAELLRAELETGRTHQIRVHLLSIGHPAVGDPVYGAGGERGISGPDRRWAAQLAKRVSRQFLHASELRFEHPRTGEALAFTAPLPDDLAQTAAWARSTSGG